ncbi:hypothetical protein FOA52_004862 [Chlamydomonas sp. UWO 241]|nr:hypothetical protein FOA52_004862 [Chlamydomonas sp. UWO 241]
MGGPLFRGLLDGAVAALEGSGAVGVAVVTQLVAVAEVAAKAVAVVMQLAAVAGAAAKAVGVGVQLVAVAGSSATAALRAAVAVVTAMAAEATATAAAAAEQRELAGCSSGGGSRGSCGRSRRSHLARCEGVGSLRGRALMERLEEKE